MCFEDAIYKENKTIYKLRKTWYDSRNLGTTPSHNVVQKNPWAKQTLIMANGPKNPFVEMPPLARHDHMTRVRGWIIMFCLRRRETRSYGGRMNHSYCRCQQRLAGGEWWSIYRPLRAIWGSILLLSRLGACFHSSFWLTGACSHITHLALGRILGFSMGNSVGQAILSVFTRNLHASLLWSYKTQ